MFFSDAELHVYFTHAIGATARSRAPIFTNQRISLCHLCQSLYRSLHKMFSYLIQAALLQALYYISFHFVSHNNQQKMNIPNLPFSIPNWRDKDFDEYNERLLYHNFCSPLLLAVPWYFVGIATLKFDSVYLWPGYKS